MEKTGSGNSKKRTAQPPDLIGGPLSPKNAAWLAEQQQKERDHRRNVAARRYELERENGDGQRAYGSGAIAVAVDVELVAEEPEQVILQTDTQQEAQII